MARHFQLGVMGLKGIGITILPEESNLAFDAAKLNPAKSSKRKPK